MGVLNWFEDRWRMMLRTKPHYISVLGRKRSSLSSPPKLSSPREEKCGKRFGIFLSVVTMFCSISYGILLVLSEGMDSSSLTTYLVSLVIAGVLAVTSGSCAAEYISNQSQEVTSIYSCCYQNSSEILAFFIGWTGITSQIALISAVCKVLNAHVNEWTNDLPRKLLDNIFYDYAKDVPSLIFVLIFVLFILTGFGGSVIWFVLFIPLTFVMIAAIYIIGCCVSNTETPVEDMLSFNYIKGVDEILTRTILCILFFSGPQSLFRIPLAHARKNISTVLKPLNVIIFIVVTVFILATPLSGRFVIHSSSNEILCLASNILCIISLSSIGIEAFYPLHFTIEDMASDGLLFRSFSKKWKPFCFPVLTSVVHVLSFFFIGVMSVFLSLMEVLSLAAVFPLLVGSLMPYMILFQRYKCKSTWQYEPLFQTAVKNASYDRSRKKSEEFQYSRTPGFDITDDYKLSSTCIEEHLSDSTSSDTDIDSVVEQYKEQTRIANVSSLDESLTSTDQVPEPTSSTACRAKVYISILIMISVAISMLVNFGNLQDNIYFAIAALLCVIISAVVQSLLMCLPQNRKVDKTKCCAKLPGMPWSPCMASMISFSLLVHALKITWRGCLGSFVAGFLLYFLYGIRSSTAANSFYNMRTTHITLRPLPSYGKNCVPQIIPSQRKMIKSRKHRKLKTGNL